MNCGISEGKICKTINVPHRVKRFQEIEKTEAGDDFSVAWSSSAVPPLFCQRRTASGGPFAAYWSKHVRPHTIRLRQTPKVGVSMALTPRKATRSSMIVRRHVGPNDDDKATFARGYCWED
jgi:hypothetical protein